MAKKLKPAFIKPAAKVKPAMMSVTGAKRAARAAANIDRREQQAYDDGRSTYARMQIAMGMDSFGGGYD